MSKLRVESFTISLDGFGAGPHQDLANPLGIGTPEQLIKALGNVPTQILALKPGEKAEF